MRPVQQGPAITLSQASPAVSGRMVSVIGFCRSLPGPWFTTTLSDSRRDAALRLEEDELMTVPSDRPSDRARDDDTPPREERRRSPPKQKRRRDDNTLRAGGLRSHTALRTGGVRAQRFRFAGMTARKKTRRSPALEPSSSRTSDSWPRSMASWSMTPGARNGLGLSARGWFLSFMQVAALRNLKLDYLSVTLLRSKLNFKLSTQYYSFMIVPVCHEFMIWYGCQY